ncbi:MAG: 50S ribosomal protein L25 [Candidatus Riflebacteria bacterium]|nr:50S ribosomal protein L25 [Candidatus Riflebacteria bacterium]
MAEFALNAEVRTKTGQGESRRLRKSGIVPAVIYGKGVDPISCMLKRRDVEAMLGKVNPNAIIKIDFAGKEKTRDVIVREIEKEPLSAHLNHIDFQAIDPKVPIQVAVDLKFVGEPIGRKSGAIFTAQVRRVRIECLPSKIPTNIEVDVTELDVGHSLHVADIKKADYKMIASPKITLCQMSIVKEEAVAVAAVAEGAVAPAEGAAAAPAAAGAAAAAAPAAAAKKEGK